MPKNKMEKVKPGIAYTKSGKKKITGTATTTPAGKKPKLPPDYDVILPGMGYTKPTKKNPPKKITKTNAKPVPMPKGPKTKGKLIPLPAKKKGKK